MFRGSGGKPAFSAQKGDCPIPPPASTTDVGFITGGLHKQGWGYLPRRTDVLLANLFGLTFLDSGALPVCVYRFSGVSIRLGAWGVVVKGIEYDSLISDVDHVTGRVQGPVPCLILPRAAPIGPVPWGLRQEPFPRILARCPAGLDRSPGGRGQTGVASSAVSAASSSAHGGCTRPRSAASQRASGDMLTQASSGENASACCCSV